MNAKERDARRHIEELAIYEIGIAHEQILEVPMRETIAGQLMFGFFSDVCNETRSAVKYPVADGVSSIRWVFPEINL